MIPQEAFDRIVEFEVTSQEVYEAKYSGASWPGGESGVTIGIGYDLGYVTLKQFDEDWSVLHSTTRDFLKQVIGLKGTVAKEKLRYLGAVKISWENSLYVFREKTLPKVEAETLRTFPGVEDLDPLCFGALVSLVYNRGASLKGDRRREMLQIQQTIAAGKPEYVPGQFRQMKRLWPDVRGLRLRRDVEADLFQKGLSKGE